MTLPWVPMIPKEVKNITARQCWGGVGQSYGTKGLPAHCDKNTDIGHGARLSYSQLPSPEEKESSRKKYGLETRWQRQGGCPATKLLGGTFRQQTQIIFIVLWSIFYAGRAYMWGLLVIRQVFLCQLL